MQHILRRRVASPACRPLTSLNSPLRLSIRLSSSNGTSTRNSNSNTNHPTTPPYDPTDDLRRLQQQERIALYNLREHSAAEFHLEVKRMLDHVAQHNDYSGADDDDDYYDDEGPLSASASASAPDAKHTNQLKQQQQQQQQQQQRRGHNDGKKWKQLPVMMQRSLAERRLRATKRYIGSERMKAVYEVLYAGERVAEFGEEIMAHCWELEQEPYRAWGEGKKNEDGHGERSSSNSSSSHDGPEKLDDKHEGGHTDFKALQHEEKARYHELHMRLRGVAAAVTTARTAVKIAKKRGANAANVFLNEQPAPNAAAPRPFKKDDSTKHSKSHMDAEMQNQSST